jgi:hypothetical protein
MTLNDFWGMFSATYWETMGFVLLIAGILRKIAQELRALREAYDRRTDLLFSKKEEEGFPDGIEGLRMRKLAADRKMKVQK